MAMSVVLRADGSKPALSRRSVFERLMGHGNQHLLPRVCKYWQQGRCTWGSHCKFVHSGDASPAGDLTTHPGVSCRLNTNTVVNDSQPKEADFMETEESTQPIPKKVCPFWLQGSCKYDDRCKFLHTDNTVSDLMLITCLKGSHEEAGGNDGITSMCMVPEAGLLFAGGADGLVKAWDSNTGTESGTLALGKPVKAVVASSGGWVFAAAGCEIFAWNTLSSERTMQARAAAEINVLVVSGDFLLAGLTSGEVCAWSFPLDGNGGGRLEGAGVWGGHPSAVTALTVAGSRIYSGSGDGSIAVYEASAGRSCVDFSTAHGGEVTGLLFWESFLLSCSLDGLVKVWAVTPIGSLENKFTLPKGTGDCGGGRSGVKGMCGTVDAEGMPVLACSYADSTVNWYSLPSFEKRGCLFSTTSDQVTSLVAPTGTNLVFSGYCNGTVKVWSWRKGADPP